MSKISKRLLTAVSNYTKEFEDLGLEIENDIENLIETPGSKVKVDMWRKCEDFQKRSTNALHNVQHCMKHTDVEPGAPKDHIASQIRQGLEHLVKAHTHLEIALTKSVELLQHYISNKPNPKHEKTLKETIHKHLTQAKTHIKAAITIIKAAVHEGLQLLSKAPSKLAHIFGIKRKKEVVASPGHHPAFKPYNAYKKPKND